MTDDVGFVPPPYPYDRLDDLKPLADRHEGGLVDFSIGTPMDPPIDAVVAALGESGLERGYPPSIGRLELREAISVWMEPAVNTTAEVVRPVRGCLKKS